MPPVTIGSCLCGKVSFRIAGSFDAFFLCHCGRCRKDTGSAHAANLFSTQASLTWEKGQDLVRTYRVAGTRHARSFCAGCGAALPGVQMDGALLVVPAGSLDSDPAISPTAHICCDSRAAWDKGLETLPEIGGIPG
ncbi:MAG: GFA family protein [Proteobacteria bacterium]|nr:GFA family protein [Pseudomonadota bacterium]MBS0573725.1 GFA family protein [Pseudomonadota bacterium]